MRDIKFRAWDKMIKKMTYDNFSVSPKGQLSFYWQPEAFHSANSILIQYTGAKDKNGKEIYDGDIIKDQNADEPERNGWIIVWHNYKWSVQLNDGKYGYIFDLNTHLNRMEVIGNIYETPELVNKPQTEHA